MAAANVDRIWAAVSSCKLFAGEALIKLKIDKTEMTDGVFLEVQFVSIYPFTTTEFRIGDTGDFEETRITNRKDTFFLRGEGSGCV
jgi:hypothetical protein